MMILSKSAQHVKNLVNLISNKRSTLVEARDEKQVSNFQRERITKWLEDADRMIAESPAVDKPKHIHIIGADKTYKSSYTLDLFDNADLRALFAIIPNNSNELTGVPCLIEPSTSVDTLRIFTRSLSDLKATNLDKEISKEQFKENYERGNRNPDQGGYLLCIKVPIESVRFGLPIIEYPGMRKDAGTIDEQKQLHDRYRLEMIDIIQAYPGIIVTCFSNNMAIPEGHAFEQVIKTLGSTYEQYFAGNIKDNLLPIVFSFNGASIIPSYCGNTNVMEILKLNMSKFHQFKILLQLVNPNNHLHTVVFGDPSENTRTWIREISHYANVAEIHRIMETDGGIEWSREFLHRLTQHDKTIEVLDAFSMHSWIETANNLDGVGKGYIDAISTETIVLQTRKKLRDLLSEYPFRYKSIQDCFDELYKPGLSHQQQSEFWQKVYGLYLEQLGATKESRIVASKALWDDICNKLDSQKHDFDQAKAEDLPYIILNVSSFYVANMVLRGDSSIFRHIALDN